ncbi:MAG: restriction endonuclease subunit S, partial [Bacteroidales bacterium]|nr:restriction endonuclease subunit S [Bacteroidales bacterium]
GFGSTEFHILRGKDGVSDSDFVYYLSRWDEVRDHAEHNMEGSSGRQRVPKQAFDNLYLCLPPLNTQRRIAAILSSLDDKIDLLHRENATLEQMAETLFRQWFVVEAKEEWEEGKLGDILSVKGGTTPSTKEPSFWDGDIAWTSPRDVTTLNGLYLFETEKRITQKGLEQISSGLLPSGTLLMSSRAPVGVLAFAEMPLAINQGYIAILDDKGYSQEFIYLWLKTNMDLVHSYSNGSTFMEISKSAFKSLDIVIPPKEEVGIFAEKIKPYFEKIRMNEIQISTLIQTRDGLLPRLMSGGVKL